MTLLESVLVVGLFGGPLALICKTKLFQTLNLIWFLSSAVFMILGG